MFHAENEITQEKSNRRRALDKGSSSVKGCKKEGMDGYAFWFL